MAFWDYQPGTYLTMACDNDVAAICPQPKHSRDVYTIGVIGRCLSKQLAQGGALAAGCRKLVSVAAPRDIRMYLQVPHSVFRCFLALFVVSSSFLVVLFVCYWTNGIFITSFIWTICIFYCEAAQGSVMAVRATSRMNSRK
jgi:hypothetical protein